jgi:hypothetical protein
MTSCFASRVQAAANSFVVVIGSMTDFYRSRAPLSRTVRLPRGGIMGWPPISRKDRVNPHILL